MPKIKFAGPMLLRLRSFATLNRIAVATYLRHAVGRRMAPDWAASLEIGIRFVRHQFTMALQGGNMVRGRLLFDSLQLETDDVYEVTATPSACGSGTWYHPAVRKTEAIVLFLHGGGYAFHGQVSVRFAQMLAHRIGATLFAPDYRLTPEHPHPAQAEDALAAWHVVADIAPPEKTVVIGDSAGGHMALMLLQTLRAEGLPQPALCVGLSPWTDIDNHSPSMTENDRYDLVQGWMAQMFGRWLDPQGVYGREALSPLFHDYKGLAPIYLQAGRREVLRDMIVTFAERQQAQGAAVTLDLWPDMPHEFQAYDNLKTSSRDALAKLVAVVHARVD